MGRMENSNQDDTRPVQPAPQDEQDLHATRPVDVRPGAGAAAELDATRPVLIEKLAAEGPSSAPATDIEQTIPPPRMAGWPAGPDEPASRAAQPRRTAWRRWTIFGLLALFLIAAASAFLGYNTGISDRKHAESTQVAIRADEQYQMGLQDLEAERFDLARQRFEYVIQINPNYPGVTDNLADVLLRMNSTATPTVAPTPTITPTPDLRGVEELFQQAQTDLANYNWTAAITTLLALRKADLNYQAVWVDDMLYVSFRNRGADKILKEGDLEGGIYDLTLAEGFGPLDADASGYQTWARLYITGASFWELDWSQAVYYFAQVAPALPNLRDGSGWTATERYRLALVGYGGQLAEAGDWCAAAEQYELALALGDDPEVGAALDNALQNCAGTDSQPPQQTDDSGLTPTPTLEITPTPTSAEPPPPPPEATPTPTSEPSPTPG